MNKSFVATNVPSSLLLWGEEKNERQREKESKRERGREVLALSHSFPKSNFVITFPMTLLSETFYLFRVFIIGKSYYRKTVLGKL